MTTYAGNEVFNMVAERGWRRGLGNLWQGEFSSWFRSTRWLKHLLLWVVLVNGFMAIMAYATSESAAGGEEGPPLFLMYGIFGGMFVAFGVMIIMQRAIVGEKREGTAAWVLSKPVTRTAFVMSRMLGNTLGILLTSALVPGVLVYVTFGAFTPLGWLPPLGFLAGLFVFALHALFWLTLTLMMGTFFESATGVIAVPIALYFALWFIPNLVPSLMKVNPLVLTFSDPEVMNSIAASLMTGTPVSTWLPLLVTVVLCVVFIAVAIWRFNRQEF
jgi:ABC-2 type transport system permease protein